MELGILAVETGTGAVYTTEAARDAAITSPTEGMSVYITASTVAAAVGTAGSLAVPTGIQTIYNGAAWVCVTPVGAGNTTGGSTTNTVLNTTFTGMTGAAPAVTLSTGTTALVSFQGTMLPPSAANIGYFCFMVSGATTLSPNANHFGSLGQSNTGYNVFTGRTVVITGLTAGVNTFTAAIAVQAGTLTLNCPTIVVQGIA